MFVKERKEKKRKKDIFPVIFEGSSDCKRSFVWCDNLMMVTF